MLSRKAQKAMHRLRTGIALVNVMVWLAAHWPEHNHEQPLKIFSSMQTDVIYALAMHGLRIDHAEHGWLLIKHWLRISQA